MTDHYDELRVAPDPVEAEELRQHLHARMASVSLDDQHGRTDLSLDADRLEIDVLVDPTAEVSVTETASASDRAPRRRLVLAAAAIAAVVAAGLAVSNVFDEGPSRVGTEGPLPTEAPTLPNHVPVWYDARGLHRGDVVEQTPVEIVELVGDSVRGALALVRSGAVYLDPATSDVWFHPWGGEPRIVGRNSAAGPGGDPNGDTAAWFEESELVVYDTAAGLEISRTDQRENVATVLSGDHNPAGNSFLQVSAERVVWYGGVDRFRVSSHDLRTQETSVLSDSPLDVHDDVEILGWPGSGSEWALRVPGRTEQPFPDLEPRARLSPSGDYALTVESSDERHAAAIVDTRTGELWPVPRNAYPWIAWSYGDIALVDTDDALLACDAARRECEPVPADRPFLMPTN